MKNNAPVGDKSAYESVKSQVQQAITHGEWHPGAMIPSRRALAKIYGVSSQTVERVVTGLIAEGKLRADNRRGTFVAERPSGDEANTSKSRSNSGLRISSARHTIGIVGSLYVDRHDHLTLNNNWVRLLVHSIEVAATRDKNHTLFVNRVLDGSKLIAPIDETIARAVSSGADSIIVIGLGAFADELDRAYSACTSNGANIPMVIVTSDCTFNRPVPSLTYDNFGAGYEAAKHLLAAGCVSIGVFAPTMATWAVDRINGVRAALRDASATEGVVMPTDPVPWNHDQEPVELAYRSAKALVRSGFAFDGVICIQDQGAFGFMNAAEEAGLLAGKDYAVIGFDDDPHSRLVSLSSMRPPIEAMGVEAARQMTLGLSNGATSTQIVLRWELVARGSTNIERMSPLTAYSLATI